MKKKYLIVSHPDDEVLWFNPLKFDKIFIIFLEREDSTAISKARKRVMEKHPLKNKITLFNFKESGFENKKSFETEKAYRDIYDDLLKKIKGLVAKDVEFWTHNAWGEYGQTEHMMVHQAVMEVAVRFSVPVYCLNGIDPIDDVKTISIDMDLDFYDGLKKLYIKEGCWTYDNNYVPPSRQFYFKVI